MVTKEIIRSQLKDVIGKFEATLSDEYFPEKKYYSGKVRDCYDLGPYRILVATDRLSCFDVVLTEIPFKGQLLTELATNWFNATSDIISNHTVATPHPNVVLAKRAEILPVEVIVRGYLAGSALRDYSAGRTVSGIKLPPGMKPYERFPTPLVTPSTKAEKGSHDTPISEAEIVDQGIIPGILWEEVKEIALTLFNRGTMVARERGLLLADTKYEFGLIDNRLILADELHTLDSSRYWINNSYQERIDKNLAPEMLDKEPIRQWLLEQGFKGDGPPPVISEDRRIEISSHYINAYELLTGKTFEPLIGDQKPKILAAINLCLQTLSQ